MDPENQANNIEIMTAELTHTFQLLRQEKGVKNPDDLDLSDPQVQEANKKHDAWITAIGIKGQTPD